MSFMRANEARSAQRNERIEKTGRMLHQGYTAQQIADYFGVTDQTARSYIRAAEGRGEVRDTNHKWNIFVFFCLILSFFLCLGFLGLFGLIIWFFLCIPIAAVMMDATAP